MIEKKLAELTAELEKLNADREINETELNKLNEKAEKMERRLTAASKLISGLAGEKVRWTEDSAKLKEDKVQLVGDVLLSSGFLSYTGPFNFAFRMRMLYDDWMADI